MIIMMISIIMITINRAFRKSSVPGNARVWELWALQTGSLHPRSHCGQYAAFPDRMCGFPF